MKDLKRLLDDGPQSGDSMTLAVCWITELGRAIVRLMEEQQSMDLSILEDVILKPGETTLCRTGLSLSIPTNYEGQIRSRSGLALNGVVVANSPGTIDSDYRGEVRVLLRNVTNGFVALGAGTRVAQLIIAPVMPVTWEETDGLSETDRGSGGFGSTGA